MIREMFREMTIISSMVVVIILGMLFLGIDGIASRPESFHGYVIDKHYKAERISVGTGTAVGSNGNVGVITTTEFDPEDFLIMVKDESGRVVTVKCDPELYYQKEIGDSIVCEEYKGLFTGAVWHVFGVE